MSSARRHPSGWSFRSYEQTTRVRRYLDDGHLDERCHPEQRLYLSPPTRDRLQDVARWTINGRYTIEPDLKSHLVTFRWAGMTTTDPLFWCQVDGVDAVECSLYDAGLVPGEPARLQGWNTAGERVIDTVWTPGPARNLRNDQMRSRVRWDGAVPVLEVDASVPFSLTVQTVAQGRFEEVTTGHPAGQHRWRYEGWFSDYAGLCLSADEYEEKHILVGRFGEGSGRWLFDPATGDWTAPPSGGRYRHRAAVVPWTGQARWAALDTGGLNQAHEIEWWVEESQSPAVPALTAWAAERGIPARVQVYGPSGEAAWWVIDPLDPMQAGQFRRALPRRVMMLPFTDASTVGWDRVRAAAQLAGERPDHRVFEAGWWDGDGAPWDPWDPQAHHRQSGQAAHGVGFMRPVAATPRALIEERKRRLPRHPCERCPEQARCAQRTPFPLPVMPWAACGGWAQGPLLR